MIRCIAIDDEKLALDLISDNIEKVSFLKLETVCSGSMEAMEALKKYQPDLIFLDIQMPFISGLQLLRTLPVRPVVIISTAFADFARESYDLDVVDYLLKPYSFERFLRAVNKARDYLSMLEKPENSQGSQKIQADYIFVKSDYRLVRINFTDVIYVEGLKDYVKIFLNDKVVVTQMSMKTIEEKLPQEQFLRVHRSFIVAFNRIDSLQKHFLAIGKREIPVGDQYRELLFKRIQSE